MRIGVGTRSSKMKLCSSLELAVFKMNPIGWLGLPMIIATQKLMKNSKKSLGKIYVPAEIAAVIAPPGDVP